MDSFSVKEVIETIKGSLCRERYAAILCIWRFIRDNVVSGAEQVSKPLQHTLLPRNLLSNSILLSFFLSYQRTLLVNHLQEKAEHFQKKNFNNNNQK